MKYFITGATGYIGSMLVKYIMDEQSDADITIAVRNIQKAREMFADSVTIIQTDITDSDEMLKVQEKYDYIIHCASETKSANMIAYPVETSEGIINGTQNVLDLAMRCNVKSMVYLSSMEIYGDIACLDGHRVHEDELGNVDIFSSRSCYPMSKRMAESLCYFFYKEYQIPIKIARLSQTFGLGVLPDETRVFAQFAKAVINKKDIVLNTEGHSMGNYCDINDTIRAIMLLLQNGANGEAYNIVNEKNTMTIRDMARLVVEEIANGEIDVVVSPQTDLTLGYAPDTQLKLSADKITGLGWQPTKDIKHMYLDLISALKENERVDKSN